MELYRRHRPTELDGLLGQPEAVASLKGMGENVPHAILFFGPSGTGKTTAARIMKGLVGCHDNDFIELDGASNRGIDDIRAIKATASLAPMSGKSRVWILDECFPATTLISTPSGSRPICSLQPGDQVHNIAGLGRVEHVFKNIIPLKRLVKLYLSDGRSLVTTASHEFLTISGWIEAKNLKGACILGIGRSVRVRVDSVEVYEPGCNDSSFMGVVSNQDRLQGTVTFYDLQVSDNPSYFAEGLPVHNCQKFTSDAQSSLLKVLEDTPRSAWFFLCTTDPNKLNTAVRSRCTPIAFKAVGAKQMAELIAHVLKQEKKKLESEVIERIVEVADGSARQALVILEKCLNLKTTEVQLQAVQSSDARGAAIDVCRALMAGRPWKEIAKILKSLDEEPESVRRMMLGYFNAILLNGNEKAANIIEELRENVFDSGKAGLSLAVWRALQTGKGR